MFHCFSVCMRVGWFKSGVVSMTSNHGNILYNIIVVKAIYFLLGMFRPFLAYQKSITAQIHLTKDKHQKATSSYG